MSDEKPDDSELGEAAAKPDDQPQTPSKYTWERDCRGHLTAAARPLMHAELLRLYRAGAIRSVAWLAAEFGLSKPTIRTAMENLGLVGGAGNQNKPGGVTVRTKAAETPHQRKKRKARERADKQAATEALKLEQGRIRRERGESDPAPEDLPSDPGSGSDLPARPQPPKARPKAEDRSTAPDLLAAFAVPAAFDPQEWVRKIAAAPWVDERLKLTACEILIKLSGGAKGKIDWSKVRLENIPEELRHRFAGELVGWLDFAELPEVVRLAPAVCRQVYRLTGVLPSKAEDAEPVLARWEEMRAELRVLAGEVRMDTKPQAAPLDLDLAAETSYTAPAWETDGAN